jgi:uncharacterized RDD family membrane protein YckC
MTEERIELHGGFEIETPEQVAFRLERAGLGTRAVAALIDTVILVVLYAAVIFAFFFGISSVAGIDLWNGDAESTLVLVLWAAFILLSMLLFEAYYIGFETYWNGQTPGKRALGIRVVADDGLPAGLGKIVIRNLMRLIDMQASYAVGVVAIFVSPEEKRLGDIVAGTVVIRESRPRSPELMRLGEPTATARRLDPDVVDLVRRYWARAGTIDPKTRWRLARDVVNRLTDVMGRPRVPASRVESELHSMTRELFETESRG